MLRRHRCGAIPIFLLLLSSVSCRPESPNQGVDSGARVGTASPPVGVAREGEQEPPLDLAAEYRGTLGREGAVVVRLAVAAGRVTGSYFLESDGVTHPLSGAAKGRHVTLESTSAGVRAGTLSLDKEGDGALVGTWSDASNERGGAVRWEALTAAPRAGGALLFKRNVRATRPARDSKGRDGACKTSLSYAEVYALPPAIESRLNAELAPPAELLPPEICEHPRDVVLDYRVVHNADGLLSVRITSSVTDGDTSTVTRGGRALTVGVLSGAPVRLFGDVVKPKSERVFESAVSAQIGALVRKYNLDSAGRKALDAALAFSPPFVLEESGVHLFADALPSAFAAAGAEGILVRYATLPRPAGAAAVMWGR
jgi:hypothetical protein